MHAVRVAVTDLVSPGTVSGQSAGALAELFATIGRHLLARTAKEADAAAAITATSILMVPGAQYASISQGRRGKFCSVAATDPAAERADAIQYELGSGPCVDAILDDVTYRTGDLPADTRWPQFGPRAFAAVGARSMLSFRLFFQDDEGLIAGLNLYSNDRDAFDDDAMQVGTVLATHGALAVLLGAARERATNLNRALESNREIGIAIGVLMATYKVTREQGFDLLRIASQNSNRKLINIATDVADTGTITLPAGGTQHAAPAPPRS
jgi:hypothetical protein